MTDNKPIGTILERVIYLDSRDADQYLSTKIIGNESTQLHSNCLFNLEEKLEIPEQIDLLISLNSATIPYSFYNIRNNVNNRIEYAVYDKTSGTALFPGLGEAIVPEGNYSALSLAQYLTDAIDNISGANPLVPVSYLFDYTQNWNNDLGKYEFGIVGQGADAGKTLEFHFLGFNPVTNTQTDLMVGPLGLKPNEDFIFSGAPQPNTNLSPNFVDVNDNLHGLFIRTNLTSANTMESQSKSFSNILSRIPITTNPGDVIFKQPNDVGHKCLVQTKNISQIVVRLVDDRNNVLDLNGLHFQLSIKFEYQYAQNIAPLFLTREQSRQQAEDNIYGVKSDTSIPAKMAEAMNQYNLIQKNKGGRPRKVGRPKGSKKTKIIS